MDELIGTIKLFAGNFAPQGYADCDGSLLQIMQNQVLFAILGTQYGGDGTQTFALPNLTAVPGVDPKAAPVRYIICVQGVFPSRA